LNKILTFLFINIYYIVLSFGVSL